MDQPKISITISGDRYFIWTVQDVEKLRSDHRIVGQLIGASVGKAFQDTEHGLPLQLSKYEVKLLLDKNAAHLLRVNHDQANKQQLRDQLNEYKERMWQEYKDCVLEERRAKLLEHADQIIAGAKRRRPGESNDPQAIINEKLNQIKVEESERPAQLFVNCPFGELLTVAANESPPMSDDEQFKYKIFLHLYNEGFHLTSGHKFGVDFLAYEGDPLIYHAKFMILVKSHTEHERLLSCKQLTALEMLIKGRLSVQVNKKLLIASINDQNEPQFVSINWKGRMFKQPNLRCD